MATIRIKNMNLGEGIPKICVPLTCGNLAELENALKYMRGKPFDLIEWRVDKYALFRDFFAKDNAADISDIASLERASTCNTTADESCAACHEARKSNIADAPSNTLSTDIQLPALRKASAELKKATAAIRTVFPNKPLIFTIRTNKDMEDFELSDEAYADAVSYAVIEGLGDIIDIEYSRGAALVSKLVKLTHDCGLKVIVSRHVADSTPSEKTIVNTLHDMQAVGADIVKFAAMPQDKADVKSLLDATYSYAKEATSVPVITMSMGKLGVLSRISGSLTGSCLTFGTVGAASAPGQIDCEELKRILDILS